VEEKQALLAVSRYFYNVVRASRLHPSYFLPAPLLFPACTNSKGLIFRETGFPACSTESHQILITWKKNRLSCLFHGYLIHTKKYLVIGDYSMHS
jgi:hypothetical protein